MPNMTHVFNKFEHDFLAGKKEIKVMKCVRLFAVGDELGFVFKNQVVEAECTRKTMLVKNNFYKLNKFEEASGVEKLKFYHGRKRAG